MDKTAETQANFILQTAIKRDTMVTVINIVATAAAFVVLQNTGLQLGVFLFHILCVIFQKTFLGYIQMPLQ